MRGTDADALQRSHAEGARDGRAALLRDLGELRDEWHDTIQRTKGWNDVPPQWQVACEVMDEKLLAIIDKHAKDAPAGPDLRAMVLALTEAEQALTWAQYSGRRKCGYCNQRDTDSHAKGCWIHETIEYVRAALKAAAAPAAPKAGEAPNPDERVEYRCDTCDFVAHPAVGPVMFERGISHLRSDEGAISICTGSLVPVERRKGGEG